MIEAQILATISLTLRLIAVGLIAAVIYRQIHNIRTLETPYKVVRMTVLILTMVLFFGQVIPIVLDTIVALGNLYPGRNPLPNLYAISYTVNNALKDVVIGALLVFLHYRPGSNKH